MRNIFDVAFLLKHKRWMIPFAGKGKGCTGFLCMNGKCIDSIRESDGVNDCGDNSDELSGRKV